MIIGIGGVSQAGKTTLANQLKKVLEKHNKSAVVLSQDDFVKNRKYLPTIKGYPDWDHPTSFQWDRLFEAVKNSSAEITIIEGVIAFHSVVLNSLYNLKIFLEISRDLFLERRAQETRWGVEPRWYYDHVWDCYLRFGQISNKDEVIRLDGSSPYDVAAIAQMILSD